LAKIKSFVPSIKKTINQHRTTKVMSVIETPDVYLCLKSDSKHSEQNLISQQYFRTERNKNIKFKTRNLILESDLNIIF
jgi:hypothetical protein